MDSTKLPGSISSEMDDTMNKFFMLAHDIKSPVNQIKKLLNLAKSAGSEAETNKIIDLAINSSETLSDKVRQYLNLALQPQNDDIKIDFTQMFESIKSSLRNTEGFNRTKFITSIDDNIVLYGNPVKLQSIFLNLIENAIKYRKSANHQNIIIFTIHEAANSIIVKVGDNGMGIKREHLLKVFDKAYKVHNGNNGHGLGLHLVKKNLNEMGATINVESREGEGTTFSIELPGNKQIRSAVSA